MGIKKRNHEIRYFLRRFGFEDVGSDVTFTTYRISYRVKNRDTVFVGSDNWQYCDKTYSGSKGLKELKKEIVSFIEEYEKNLMYYQDCCSEHTCLNIRI